jgi:hypothetical protein
VSRVTAGAQVEGGAMRRGTVRGGVGVGAMPRRTGQARGLGEEAIQASTAGAGYRGELCLSGIWS